MRTAHGRSMMGQSALEYAVLVSAVIAAMIGMGRYVQRALDTHIAQIDEEQAPTPP